MERFSNKKDYFCLLLVIKLIISDHFYCLTDDLGFNLKITEYLSTTQQINYEIHLIYQLIIKQDRRKFKINVLS